MTKPPYKRNRTAWKSAERCVQQSTDLSEREKRLVLEYVRTAMQAILANRSLWRSVRAGAMGPHAMATALALLVTLATEDMIAESS